MFAGLLTYWRTQTTHRGVRRRQWEAYVHNLFPVMPRPLGSWCQPCIGLLCASALHGVDLFDLEANLLSRSHWQTRDRRDRSIHMGYSLFHIHTSLPSSMLTILQVLPTGGMCSHLVLSVIIIFFQDVELSS